MKTLLAVLATMLLTSFASAAKEGWLEDFEKAKAQAKAENKKILLDFTGSDWCGWCIKLDKEVFSQQAWKDYAAKNLVLVELDFPAKGTHARDQSAERKAQGEVPDPRLPNDHHHERERHEEASWATSKAARKRLSRS